MTDGKQLIITRPITACVQNFGIFVLGAGPRAWQSLGQLQEGAWPGVVADDDVGDSDDSARDAVVCRLVWSDTFGWHANCASGGLVGGRNRSNNGLADKRARTGAHNL